MDNQETKEVTQTYADGSTVTMTIDRKTGALLDYNATPPPPRTTGAGLQELAKRVETLEQSPKGSGSSFVVTDLAYTAETMNLSLEQMFVVALSKKPKADIVRITKTEKNKILGEKILVETFVRIPVFEIIRLDDTLNPAYGAIFPMQAFLRVSNKRRYMSKLFPRKAGDSLAHYMELFVESALDESFYTFIPSKVEGQDGQFNTADGSYQEDEQVKWYKQFLTAPQNTVASMAQGLPEEHKQLPEKLQKLTENVSKLSEKQDSQESKIAEALKIKTELKTELSKSVVSPSQIWDNGTSGQLTPDFAASVAGAASSRLLPVLDEELQKLKTEISSLKAELEFLKNNH
jgi:hypothetical protein